MSEEFKPKLDDFTSKVVTDPAKPQETLLLHGFLGASSEPDHTRVYADMTLESYVDVANADIIHIEPMPKETSPMGGSYLWVKKDTEVITDTGTAEKPNTKAKFLQGPIAAEAAGAVGNAPGIVLPNLPKTVPPILCHPTIAVQACFHTVVCNTRVQLICGLLPSAAAACHLPDPTIQQQTPQFHPAQAAAAFAGPHVAAGPPHSADCAPRPSVGCAPPPSRFCAPPPSRDCPPPPSRVCPAHTSVGCVPPHTSVGCVPPHTSVGCGQTSVGCVPPHTSFGCVRTSVGCVPPPPPPHTSFHCAHTSVGCVHPSVQCIHPSVGCSVGCIVTELCPPTQPGFDCPVPTQIDVDCPPPSAGCQPPTALCQPTAADCPTKGFLCDIRTILGGLTAIATHVGPICQPNPQTVNDPQCPPPSAQCPAPSAQCPPPPTPGCPPESAICAQQPAVSAACPPQPQPPAPAAQFGLAAAPAAPAFGGFAGHGPFHGGFPAPNFPRGFHTAFATCFPSAAPSVCFVCPTSPVVCHRTVNGFECAPPTTFCHPTVNAWECPPPTPFCFPR